MPQRHDLENPQDPPESNVLDVIESTVVVFTSYAVKTCTAEKVVIGPRAGIKRALE